MNSRANFLSASEIDACLAAIRDKFLHECMTGARRRVLPENVWAAGQYFDLPNRTQRGLHGTAAALRVIGAENANSDLIRTVARGIVAYVREREATELSVAGVDGQARAITMDKLRHDNGSTIKQSEVLYALTYIPNGLAECDDLKTAFSTRLLRGGAENGHGWGFILGADQAPHPLATAHALRALIRNGHALDARLSSAKKGLLARSEQPRWDILGAGIDCFMLQVLLEADVLSGREGRTVFDSLWRTLRRDLESPREINVDFFDGDRQNFVRVPWQLHLAVAAAAVRPYRRYLSGDLQRALKVVTNGVLSEGGFRYPESGEHLSTRTYGIIYDTLFRLSGRDSSRGHPGNMTARVTASIDLPLRILRRTVQLTGAVLALLILGAGLWSWYGDETSTLSDLAPNFISAVVLAVLSYVLMPRNR